MIGTGIGQQCLMVVVVVAWVTLWTLHFVADTSLLEKCARGVLQAW